MTIEPNDTDLEPVIEGSGNVFADLDLPHSEEDLLKIQISRAIAATLRRRKLTQTQAAEIMGTDQAKVSAVLRGRMSGLTVDRLFRWLVRLGRDVDIRVSSQVKDEPGRVKFVEAA